MPKKRDIPGQMKEGQNYTNHETGYTNVRGNHQISSHKPSLCGRENTGKALINRINHYMYSTEFLNKKPVWIYCANEHIRRDFGLKIFGSERIRQR